MTNDNLSRRLLQAGMLLFLLGLLTGFAVPALTNSRMALASHLEGVLNGIFLIALGLLWPKLLLGAALQRLTVTLALFGTFANWLATLVAAASGAGAMMPLAGGREGTTMAELLISGLLVSLSVAMVAVTVLVMWGLRAPRDTTVAGGPAEPSPH